MYSEFKFKANMFPFKTDVVNPDTLEMDGFN